MQTEYRPLLMRANRLLGSALIEHNLVKFEDLEAANERLLEVAATGQVSLAGGPDFSPRGESMVRPVTRPRAAR